MFFKSRDTLWGKRKRTHLQAEFDGVRCLVENHRVRVCQQGVDKRESGDISVLPPYNGSLDTWVRYEFSPPSCSIVNPKFDHLAFLMMELCNNRAVVMRSGASFIRSEYPYMFVNENTHVR